MEVVFLGDSSSMRGECPGEKAGRAGVFVRG